MDAGANYETSSSPLGQTYYLGKAQFVYRQSSDELEVCHRL